MDFLTITKIKVSIGIVEEFKYQEILYKQFVRFFGKQIEVSICVYKTKIIYQAQAIACGQRKQLKEEKTKHAYILLVQREKQH